MARPKIQLRDEAAGGVYDLDGWRLETLDVGTVLDLRVGQGYLIFALAAFTVTDPRWRLMLVDCAVYHIDEIELRADGALFTCPRVTLPLPDGACVTIEREGVARALPLDEATFEASAEPERYELRLVLRGGVELRWDSALGWRQVVAGQPGPCPPFTVQIQAMLH